MLILMKNKLNNVYYLFFIKNVEDRKFCCKLLDNINKISVQ